MGDFVGIGTDIVKVVRLIYLADRQRCEAGPRRAVAWARSQGQRAVARDQAGSARLRRAIRLVDRFYPSGPNCYRRSLLEAALDPAAAAAPFFLGFRTGGGRGSGHAWIGQPGASDGDAALAQESYDVRFVL